MPTSTTSDPVASVRQAIECITPVVRLWRDGLTVIPLASGLPTRAPEYLIFDQAQADGAIEVGEAPQQTVPTVDATTKTAPVLILGGDTIIGGRAIATSTRVRSVARPDGRWMP